MTHLGSLGKPKNRDAVVFDYFGVDITAKPGLSDLHHLDFMEKAADLAPSDPKSWGFVKDFARMCLGNSFDEFWQLALDNGQDQQDVYETLTKVLEAATARPTESPSDSSDGPRDIEPNSTAGSSSLAARLAGRPDLQLVVAQARAARSA